MTTGTPSTFRRRKRNKPKSITGIKIYIKATKLALTTYPVRRKLPLRLIIIMPIPTL